MKASKEELQIKVLQLEKSLQSIKNENELLQNELSQKNQILEQTNNELTKIQEQYKEALDKIIELSHKKQAEALTQDDNIYLSQIHKQAISISDLSNRLWDAEYKHKVNTTSLSNCSSQTNKKDLNKNEKENILGIKKKYKSKVILFQKEIKKWKNFALLVFDIASEAIGNKSSFPSHDSSSQRRIASEMVKKLANTFIDDSELQNQYNILLKKYNELNRSLNFIKEQNELLKWSSEAVKLQIQSIHGYHNTQQIHNMKGEISKYEEIVKEKYYYNDDAQYYNTQNHQIINENIFSNEKNGNSIIQNPNISSTINTNSSLFSINSSSLLDDTILI